MIERKDPLSSKFQTNVKRTSGEILEGHGYLWKVNRKNLY